MGIENREKFLFIPANSTIATYLCFEIARLSFYRATTKIELKPESPIKSDSLSNVCSRWKGKTSDNTNKHYHVKGNHIKNFSTTNFDNRAPIPNINNS